MSVKRKTTDITDIPSVRPVCYDTTFNIMCVNCYHYGCPCMNCDHNILHKNATLKQININWETFKKYSTYDSSNQTYEDYARLYSHEYNSKQKKLKIKN